MNVYDFDETVYAGECSIEFFIFYFRKDPFLVKYLPSVLKAFALYKQEKISLDDFLNQYGKPVEEYIASHTLEFENAVSRFWDKNIKKIKPFYLENQKDDDVIITASPDFLVGEVCSRLGIKNLISTHIDLKSGKIEKPCFREAKIARFRETFPNGVIDDFFTDSMNDKFLMPFASRVFLVKGNKFKQVK